MRRLCHALTAVLLALGLSITVAPQPQAQWLPPGALAPAPPPVAADEPAAAPLPAPQPAPASNATRGKPDRKAATGKAGPASKIAKPAPNPYPYYIEFRSRGAVSYGHTFMMFGRVDERGGMIPGEVAGLHPAGGVAEYMAGHILPVPAETGPSDGDLDEAYLNNRYRINLTPEQYERVVGYIRHKQATSKFWHATTNNCNGWAGDVAEFMGLKAPGHMLLPPSYIEELKRMNRGVATVNLPAGAFASALQ